MAPPMAKMTDGMKSEPKAAGKGGVQPPRKRITATDDTVIMFAYSAMKNAANFMLLYSVWKPATSSFSASGRSNGMRLVSAKAEIRNRMKLKICGKGPWKMTQWG